MVSGSCYILPQGGGPTAPRSLPPSSSLCCPIPTSTNMNAAIPAIVMCYAWCLGVSFSLPLGKSYLACWFIWLRTASGISCRVFWAVCFRLSYSTLSRPADQETCSIALVSEVPWCIDPPFFEPRVVEGGLNRAKKGKERLARGSWFPCAGGVVCVCGCLLGPWRFWRTFGITSFGILFRTVQ